jgi:hypothetical protein
MAFYRLIFRVRFQLAPLIYMHIPLTREGQTATGNSNGMPRSPVKRTIDLRPGDQVMSDGQWWPIVAVRVESQWWIEEAKLRADVGNGDGYLYRPRRQPVEKPAAETRGGIQHYRVRYADGVEEVV